MEETNSRIEELRDEIYMNVELELVESLPLCNRETEVLFYYNVAEKENIYFLDEIYYIFYINKMFGDITEVTGEEFISEDIRDEVEFSYIPTVVDGLEAENLADEYEELYFWFVELDFKEELNEEEKKKLRRFKKIFDLLVPDSVLKDLYISLGYEMFSYIENILE